MIRSILAAVLTCATVGAQSFEVASIKQHILPVQRIGIEISGTRVAVIAMSLTNLIFDAYNLKSYQVSGAPKWATDLRWDIAARAGGDTALTRAQVRKMMQALLADRFQVKFHHEMKEMGVYTLSIGKNGPKLIENRDPNAVPMLTMGGPRGLIQINTAKGSIDQLTDQLSGNIGQPVVDLTGLTAAYDYKLEWAPEDAANSNAPTIFTAVQEQLGLKLESTKRPVEVLIVDRAERPSEN